MIRSSDSIDELCAAFVAAQAEFPAVPKETRGQVGNAVRMYADLATVIETLQPVLAKHGLGYVQFPATSGPGHVAVGTRLIHKSGQWMEDEVAMPVGNGGAQGVGSGITYARRYSLLAVLGVATEDDDGAAASTPSRTRQKPAAAPQPTEATPDDRPTNAATDAQIQRMAIAFKEVGITDRGERLEYVARYTRQVDSSKELTKQEAGKVLDALEELARTRRTG